MKEILVKDLRYGDILKPQQGAFLAVVVVFVQVHGDKLYIRNGNPKTWIGGPGYLKNLEDKITIYGNALDKDK